MYTLESILLFFDLYSFAPYYSALVSFCLLAFLAVSFLLPQSFDVVTDFRLNFFT